MRRREWPESALRHNDGVTPYPMVILQAFRHRVLVFPEAFASNDRTHFQIGREQAERREPTPCRRGPC